MVGHPTIVGAREEATRAEGRSCQALMADATLGALAEAGLGLAEVDAVFTSHTWEEPTLMESVLLAERLGIEPALCETVSLGGASPVAMVGRAAASIEAGDCSVAVLASAGNRSSGLGREAAIAALRDVAHPTAEVPFGAYIPALYALLAARHMHSYGTTSEQLAAVAVGQRANAATRALAAKTKPISVADVLASPLIASPLHMLDCCLVTDFAAALVITAEDRADAGAKPPVRVLGWGEGHGPLSLTRTAPLEAPAAARRAGEEAFRRARVRPGEIESAQLYDSFTITVLLLLEALGLAAPGEAAGLVESGATGPDGRLPLNTNGGMLSFATGGMFHLTEAVATLRDERLGRPVDTAAVHGVGGIFSSHATAILGTERTG
ncbi:MAG: hypothetical protein QM729_20820 [Solirubrobacterales bacterium]